MATREENLKKINDELEKLDDEQLEKVAGGKVLKTPDDKPNTEKNPDVTIGLVIPFNTHNRG